MTTVRPLSVRIQRIVPLEEEVTQAVRKRLVAQRSRSPFGEALEIQCFVAEHFEHRFAPGGIFRKGVSGILGEPLQRVLQHMEAIPDGKLDVQLVSLLKKIDGQRQHFGGSERQMVAQDRQFIVPRGVAYSQGRLKSGQDIIGHLVCACIFIHRHAAAEVVVRVHQYPGDDLFDAAPMIEQRGERRPAFFIHAVALI